MEIGQRIYIRIRFRGAADRLKIYDGKAQFPVGITHNKQIIPQVIMDKTIFI